MQTPQHTKEQWNQILDDGQCGVSLTISPGFGTGREKGGAAVYGVQDVNQEDYWIAKGMVLLDNDNSGDYPQLDRRATLRVDADPAHIREEEVAHFRDFHKTDDALFISQAEMIEGVRFKYLGFPFEEAAKKQVPSMTDQHMKDNMYNAFKWKFPDYLCGKAVPKIYKTKEDCIKQNFISFQVGADFFVYNPLMLEVA